MQNEIKSIAAVVVPYSLMMPAIYLYFYWKQFNIQPFEFISVADSISYAFKPFILILLNLIPICFSIGINIREDHSRKSKNERFIPEGISFPFIVIFNLSIFVFAEVGIEINYWLFGCGAVLVVLCSLTLSYENSFKEFIKSSAARVTLFLVISLSPCLTVFFSILEAKNVVTKSSPSFILSSDLMGEDAKNSENLIYLGKLSEQLFILERKSKKVFVYNLSDL